MKLKYYLRGVGIGIIFATLVMALSCLIHNYNLSDEFIIKEAMKLGMVMKDEQNSDDDIWGANDNQEDTEDLVVETEGTEDTQVVGSEMEGSEVVSESESTSDPNYVTIVVERGDYARQVAEKLYAAGLVAEAEEFRVYVGEHGYGKKIRVGTYKIPVGATYEEICKIITS